MIRRAAALAGVAAGLLTGPASADEVAAPPPAPVVEIFVTANPAVETVVRELLAPLPVEQRWGHVSRVDTRDVIARGATRANEPYLLARVWIDLSDPSFAGIFVASAASGRFIVRFLPLTAGYDEVARESVAYVIESTVDALLAGADIGVSREAAERQLAERDRAPPTPPGAPLAGSDRSAVTLSLIYAASVWSPSAIRQGPGVLAFVPVRRAHRIRAGFAVALTSALPFTWSREEVGAAFAGFGVWAGAGIEVDASSRAVLRFLGGAGLDALHVASEIAMPGITPSEPGWVTSPLASVLATVEIRIGARVALVAGAGAEVDLLDTRYAIELADGSRQVRLQPWFVRPLVVLGISAAL
jgi:hypothetical protein